MNLQAVEVAGEVAKLLAQLSTEEQLQVLLFLTEMTRRAGHVEQSGEAVPSPQAKPKKETKQERKPTSDVISYTEAGRLLGMTRRGVANAVWDGRLKKYPLGDSVGVSRAEIEAYAARRNHTPPKTTKTLTQRLPSDLITYSKAAALKKCPLQSLYSWVYLKRLKSYKTPAGYRLSRAEVMAVSYIPTGRRKEPPRAESKEQTSLQLVDGAASNG